MFKGKIHQIIQRIWTDVYNYRIGIFIFGVYYIVIHMVLHAFCPMVLLTGFPCAGCGMTRAVLAVLKGQFARAWNLNPMALPVLLFLGYCMWMRYILCKKVKGIKAGIVILVAGMLLTYGYRMCTIFPNRPPYVYTENNLMERCIPFYADILHRVLGI